jgi:hypothetical protein
LKARLLVLGGLLLAAFSAVLVTLGAGRGAAVITTPARAPQPASRPAHPDSPPSDRNVFEYVDEPRENLSLEPPATPLVARPFVEDTAPPPSPPPVLRLVGFVRRSGGVRAAVSIRGTVFVLAVGERAEGYLLLSADEDAGVQIQGPDGSAITLPSPS